MSETPSSSATPTSTLLSANTATSSADLKANSATPSLVTKTRAAVTQSSTASAAPSNDDKKSGGLSTGAIIAIVVCAVVAGAGFLAWTLFRKLKLRNNRFHERSQPLDFSPGNPMGGDDLFEKSLQRSASVASADRQRRELVAELDHDHLTAGIPDHDFTAGPTQAYAYGHQYDNGYDFSAPGQDFGYEAHPGQAAAVYPEHGYAGDHPQQDTYHGDGLDQHAHQQQYAGDGYSPTERAAPPPQGPAFDAFAGSDFAVTARPTGGAMGEAGPYAQAASYRY